MYFRLKLGINFIMRYVFINIFIKKCVIHYLYLFKHNYRNYSQKYVIFSAMHESH